MGIYDRQRLRAKVIIDKYGERVEYRNYLSELSESDKPWIGIDTSPIIYTPSIAFFSTNSDLRQLLRYMSNGEIITGNEVGYMASVNFLPTMKDTIKRNDGSVYRIKNINTLNPNGEGVILYTFEFQI